MCVDYKHTNLGCEVPGGLDGSVDSLHRTAIGCSHCSCFLCCCPQPRGVSLKPCCSLLKHLIHIYIFIYIIYIYIVILFSKKKKVSGFMYERVNLRVCKWGGGGTSSLWGVPSGAVAATASSFIGVVVSLKISDTSCVMASCILPLRS